MKHILAATIAACAIFAAPRASAQSTGQARYSAVLDVCKAEAVKYCPSASDTSSGRNQAICLRPYRTSLSLACRRAVTAATP